MAMGLSSIIAKPSTINARSSLASTSIFHPLHHVERKYGFDHYKHSSKKREQRRKLHMTISCSNQPIPPPAAPSSPFPDLPGKGWIVGIVLSFVLPFMANKWGPLLFLKKEIDTTLERVEETVEVLEKVAEGVEHLAEEVEKELPEGALKDSLSKIEKVALKAEQSAQLVNETIQKVEKLEEELVSRVDSELAKAKQTKEATKPEQA